MFVFMFVQVNTGIKYGKDASFAGVPPDNINALLASFKLRELEAEAEVDSLKKELEQVSTLLDPASFKVI